MSKLPNKTPYTIYHNLLKLNLYRCLNLTRKHDVILIATDGRVFAIDASQI